MSCVMNKLLVTGVGLSVLDIIKAYSKVIGRELPYRITSRRDGDVPVYYANPTKAKNELEWVAEKISMTWLRILELAKQKRNPHMW